MPELDPRNSSWAAYRLLVLQCLEDLEARVATVEKERGTSATVTEGFRKDLSALKKVVFGSGGEESMEVRIDRLEEFRKNHPSLLKDEESVDQGKKPRLDKKMVFLLVGAISGLVTLAAKLVDVIVELLKKAAG